MELDGFRVPFGDGSLRLMDPKLEEHTGSYTCVFSTPYSKHTERSEVTINDKSTGTYIYDVLCIHLFVYCHLL